MELQVGDGVGFSGESPSMLPPPTIQLIIGDEALVENHWYKLSSLIFVPTPEHIEKEVKKLKTQQLGELNERKYTYRHRHKPSISRLIFRKGVSNFDY